MTKSSLSSRWKSLDISLSRIRSGTFSARYRPREGRNMAHTTWRERRRFVSYRHSNRGEFVRGSANSPSMRRETLVCCTKVPRFEGVARDDDDTTDALRSEFDLPSKQTFASTTHIHIESLLSRFVRVHACTRLNPPLLFSPQGRGNRIISGCMEAIATHSLRRRTDGSGVSIN